MPVLFVVGYKKEKGDIHHKASASGEHKYEIMAYGQV